MWKQVSLVAPVRRTISLLDLVEDLYAAIVKKEMRPKCGIVLALDSIETPHLGTDVVNLFLAKYGTCVQSLSYDAIWVVGPTPELTYRLDALG